MSEPYRIVISSPPDRKRLVAEIFLGATQLAELNQEDDALVVEFYAQPDGQPWRLDFRLFIEALVEAKQRLVG